MNVSKYILAATCLMWASAYVQASSTDDSDKDIFEQGKPTNTIQVAKSTSMGIEEPDELIKRISTEVLQSAKTNKEIQSGNKGPMLELVRSKIVPYLDFERMAALAAGRKWEDATTTQKKQLVEQFQRKLELTFYHSLSAIKDQKLKFPPMRDDPATSDTVEVPSQVLQSNGQTLQLNYRLAKAETGWKIYDLNVSGIWLIENYKDYFSKEIKKGGIDGLIKTMVKDNYN